MRNRKPWVFARRRLFGWNVRLLTRGLQEKVEYGQGLEKSVRAAGQKELLRYGPTADTVKPGSACSGRHSRPNGTQRKQPLAVSAQTVENSLKHKAARC